MTTDVILSKRNGYYDFDWTDSGDISTAETLDTAILLSIFEEARAAASEIVDPIQRRGWIGNETTPDFEQGSKAWEFYQERITGSILADLGSAIRNALQWMIDFNIAASVIVKQPFLKNGKVCVNIDFSRDGSTVESLFFELWDATGNF